MLEALLWSVLMLFMYLVFAFIVGTKKKNNGIMDLFYGPGFTVVAFTSLIITGTYSLRQLIVTILVLIWSIRLSTYVFIRNRGKEEDYRYKAMRERWKTNILLKSFLKVYLWQGIVIFIVVFPVSFTNINTNPEIWLLDYFGIAIWCIGFFFETYADYQLYKFLQNPSNRDKIMKSGVWKYSMHPNYFGEVSQWWGLYIVALSVPFGFITAFGPALITFMILKVSGVKLLDKRFEGNQDYLEYRKKTSNFIPWFPKKG